MSRIGALIVDDEADIRTLLRRIIEADRDLFVSGEAADGAEALDRIDELDPEVVVLDHRMPGMSGLETLAAMLQRRPHQRVIMCSALMDADLCRQAEETGARVCLEKSQINQVPAAMHAVMSDATSPPDDA